jgi:hypothetical protein
VELEDIGLIFILRKCNRWDSWLQLYILYIKLKLIKIDFGKSRLGK